MDAATAASPGAYRAIQLKMPYLMYRTKPHPTRGTKKPSDCARFPCLFLPTATYRTPNLRPGFGGFTPSFHSSFVVSPIPTGSHFELLLHAEKLSRD